MRARIKELLRGVFHPELEQDIVTAGIFEGAEIEGEKVVVSLIFRKARDPFAVKIKSRVEQTIAAAYPDYKVVVVVKEGEKSAERAAKNAAIEEMHNLSTTANIKHIVAVASGKGGVGKSTISANLAITLAKMGYKVGLLDADIHGPSIPKMFHTEGCRPVSTPVNGRNLIEPIEQYGVKMLSIGFFVDPQQAVVWRGGMASNAIKQLIQDANWGELDYFLIDLPPGTSDIHLTLVQHLHLTGAIVVTTPQPVALVDARKGVDMFINEKINVPVLGLVENMAWFTPAELPNNRYYIFGKDGGKQLAEELNIPLLGQVPLVQSIREGGDEGTPIALQDGHPASQMFESICQHLR